MHYKLGKILGREMTMEDFSVDENGKHIKDDFDLEAYFKERFDTDYKYVCRQMYFC